MAAGGGSMPRYQAPLRDMKFLLNDVLEIGS
jgi:hypothetical protein